MSRFVVLLHETPRGHHRPTHWDLMLEDGDSLATWALEEEPSSSRPIGAELLPPHRLDYLDYAGPISDNRGAVTPWDRGTFDWQFRGQQQTIVALTGSKLDGVATLRREHDRWYFSLSSRSDSLAQARGTT